MTETRIILHITMRTAWNVARSSGTYRGNTLETEGFIHCSTVDQVLGPANAMFGGQTGLVLLCIEAKWVAPDIVNEDLTGAGEAFPHIYGPLNTSAVLQVVDFPPGEDGTFSLPQSARSLL